MITIVTIIVIDMDALYKVLLLDTLPSIRNLMELFISIIVLKFPREILPSLLDKLSDKNSRAQNLGSLITAAGNYMTYCPDEELIPAWEKIGHILIEYTNIHQFAVRSICKLLQARNCSNSDPTSSAIPPCAFTAS